MAKAPSAKGRATATTAKTVPKPLAGTERALQIEYAIRDVVVPAKALEAKGHTVLKLNVGDPSAAGFRPPAHMIEALHQAALDNVNGYTASEGDPLLIDAIIRRERRRNKVDYATGDVNVTNGSGEGIQMLFGSSVNPGDEVLIPGPSYPPYDSLVKYFGGKPVHYRTIESEDWQPDVEDLRKKISKKTKAVCLINPNNPTGALYSRKVVKQFADVVGEHQKQLFMVSDEIYDQMTFDGVQVASKTVAPDVPMVTLNGFSKIYLVPGWRLGHMLWNDPTGSLEQIRSGVTKSSRVRLSVSSVAQRAGVAALDGPQDHIAKTNAALKARRDFAVKRLNAIDGVSCAKPDGAFYAFPKLDCLTTKGGKKAWKGDKEFVLDFLNTEKVLCVHGSGFGADYGAGHMRVVLLPDIPILQTALDRLERFIRARGATQ